MWYAGSSSALVNGAAGLTIAALIIAGLYTGREMLIPLALAGILSFILFPLVHRLTSWKIPQPVAVAIVMASLVAALMGSMTLAGRQVAELVQEVPQYESNLREKAQYMHSLFGGPGIWQRATDTVRRIAEEVRDPETKSQQVPVEVAQNQSQPLMTVFEYTRSTLPALATAGLVLVVTIFILLQYGDLRDRVVRLMGIGEIGRSTQALSEAGDNLAHFFLLQASLNASFGVVVAIALWLIGLPSPALWGVVAAFMRFVPYVGSFLSAAIPIGLAAMIAPGWWMLFATAAIFILGDMIVGQFIEPVLFGSHTSLSPIAVLLSAVFWTLLWGPLGLILAVPLTLTMVVMGQHIPRLEFLGIMLGNEPVLTPPEKLYRQLLAGDAAEAAKIAKLFLPEQGLVKYLDETTIPSLHIASDDQRRGVLEREQMDELTETLGEYVVYIRDEVFESKDEQQRAQPGGGTATPPARAAAAAVIAGRGIIDQTAAELVADAIRLNLGMATQCSSLGGLTGIGAAAAAAKEAAPDVVAIISVGGVTATQMELLLTRASRLFRKSAIVVGYWVGTGVPDRPSDERKDAPVFAESVDTLVATIGRLADERAAIAAVPALAVKAG
jgi:predicted PurR-regulated permease PerM